MRLGACVILCVCVNDVCTRASSFLIGSNASLMWSGTEVRQNAVMRLKPV